MKRAKRGYSEVITTAVSLVPERLSRLVSCDFFLGTDPVFAGLHDYTSASYGRSYRDTMHVVYDFHQPRLPRALRATTIIIPGACTVPEVVHELGHVLDESLRWTLNAEPVSWYAQTNRREAFAEAFTSWLVPGYAQRPDDAFLALMDSL